MTNHRKWISIEDRLPEEKETVIAATDRGYVYIAFLDYDHEWYIFDWGDWLVARRVTHWMELPPAPGPTMTNADRIRAMTDKELAHWWCYKRPCDRCPHDETYRCTILDWLQKEEDEKRIIWRNENTDITRPKTAEEVIGKIIYGQEQEADND